MAPIRQAVAAMGLWAPLGIMLLRGASIVLPPRRAGCPRAHRLPAGVISQPAPSSMHPAWSPQDIAAKMSIAET